MLLVEDVVTTGGSVREVLELVKAAGGDVVGIGFVLLTVLEEKLILAYL